MNGYYLRCIDTECKWIHDYYLTKYVNDLRVQLCNCQYYNCFIYEVVLKKDGKELVVLSNFELKLLLYNL